MPKQKPAEGPVAYTLSVIGSSWTCLILRDLLQHGARRFQDLQDSLDGIAPTTLSERLRTREQNGVVERRFYSMSPPAGRVRADREGARPRPDCGCHAQLGTQIHEVTASPRLSTWVRFWPFAPFPGLTEMAAIEG